MTCPRCAKVNEDGAQFCSRCGIDFSKVERSAEGSDEGARPCYRHPKTMTLLACGRCEKPVCDKCVVIGPAGPRCRECAKSNVAFRPGAVGLEVKRGFRSLTRISPWYLIILLSFLASGIGGIMRGCQAQTRRPAPQQTEMRDQGNDGENRGGQETVDF